MIQITDKSKCCGCEACVQICPKDCISFCQDKEGFFYPNVNVSECIRCGACERVCPAICQSEPSKPLYICAAKNPDESIRMASSSGGIFTLLAEHFVNQNGVVFGAKFNEKWDVVHGYTETIEGIAEFRTSKYVQSRIGDSFCVARKFLKQGRKVLFSGTPCQIAALKLFLHSDYENLLTVDVVCHGVPSPKVWRLYLKAIIKDSSLSLDNSVIEHITFRDKSSGWKNYSVSYFFSKVIKEGYSKRTLRSNVYREEPYMKSFLSNISVRPSCFHCPSKGGRSMADFTLGDFWGIDHQMSDFDDDKGVGMVLLNSQLAIKIFKELSIIEYEVSVESAFIYNSLYSRSVKLHPNRSKFFHKLDKDNVDIINVMNSLSQLPFREKVWNKLRRYINRVIKMFSE